MSFKRPYIGTSEDRLVSLINEDNNTNLSLITDFTFGNISEYSDPQGRNTRVDLIASPNSGYSDDMVFYTRLSIDVLENIPDNEKLLVVVDTLPIMVHDLLSDINESLNLSLSTDEVLNIRLDSKEPSYPLTIVEGSLAWLPSTYQFKVHHREDDLQISSIITNTELNNLEF